jgi:hypothetical protein
MPRALSRAEENDSAFDYNNGEHVINVLGVIVFGK